MFIEADGAGIRSEEAQALLLADPFRVLNNYYTNQVATAQIEVVMWRAIGLCADRDARGTGSRSSE
jgi:hypothetical protein